MSRLLLLILPIVAAPAAAQDAEAIAFECAVKGFSTASALDLIITDCKTTAPGPLATELNSEIFPAVYYRGQRSGPQALNQLAGEFAEALVARLHVSRFQKVKVDSFEFPEPKATIPLEPKKAPRTELTGKVLGSVVPAPPAAAPAP
ncbi:MAG: hypothetical protein HY549_10150 [Elusimicrobia bacterium]|nr:hypothetical protein [Elusimicrobiota bacterium]